MSNPKPPQSEEPQDPGERLRRLLASEEETRPEAPTPPPEAAQPRPKGQTPPPPSTARSYTPPPAIDQHGMPLPRRVDEIDTGGTRVTPAAHAPPAAGRRTASAKYGRPPSSLNWRKGLGCLLRALVTLLFILIALGLIAGSFALYQYYAIASTLPDVDDLRQRAAQFETTRILDRNGNVLYEILDPNAGRRTYVPLEKISPNLVAATIATEDKGFYSHPGFDPMAIIRAFWQNYTSGETVSGASTITQQLARALLLSPEERTQRTYLRKLREAILAAEITRRYSKDEILELYLNEIYFGNLAYGIEAAAETYFGATADKLTLSQAAFLAGLPQSPSIYDIYTNREITLQRQLQALTLMFQLSQEQGCIYVSNSAQPICVDATAAAAAANEMQAYVFRPPLVEMRYPHWVQYVRGLLEAQYDPQTIYRSGFTIYTTLDPGLQDAAQQMIAQQVAALADRHVSDGALVAIRPSSGEILAMVGSPDFYNVAISGQVNMAVSPTRQPGSSIKPITYAAAFEKGWTPATLIWDVPSEFPPSGDPNDPRPPYVPVNYDEKFHGPVTARVALANSYNLPAVKTLQYIGIYDNASTPGEDGMVAMARRLGITSLTRPDYGLSLTLGGGDVSLLDMTAAYAVFAAGGRRVPPVAITKILDHEGKVVFEYQFPTGEQVIRPEHAFLISSILSDSAARAPMFGSRLNLPFAAAVKTGTTNDFRDNWTLGYTPDIAVGVWVGNADYTPMEGTTGLSGAAPVWVGFIQTAIQQLTGNNPAPFVKPAGVIEKVICAASGTEPSQWCSGQRPEYFAFDQPPLPPGQDLWRRTRLDTWTGLEASAACPDFVDEQMVLKVPDPWARKWLKSEDGKKWLEEAGFPRQVFFAPERECQESDPRPTLEFSDLSEGQAITAKSLDIFGIVTASRDFKYWTLDYGLGDDPVEWTMLVDKNEIPLEKRGKLDTWDLTNVPNGTVTLRLYLQSSAEGYAEWRIHLSLQVPTPTPTPTATSLPTDTPTPTETPTPPPPPSDTPMPTETPTRTP